MDIMYINSICYDVNRFDLWRLCCGSKTSRRGHIDCFRQSTLFVYCIVSICIFPAYNDTSLNYSCFYFSYWQIWIIYWLTSILDVLWVFVHEFLLKEHRDLEIKIETQWTKKTKKKPNILDFASRNRLSIWLCVRVLYIANHCFAMYHFFCLQMTNPIIRPNSIPAQCHTNSKDSSHTDTDPLKKKDQLDFGRPLSLSLFDLPEVKVSLFYCSSLKG